MPIHCRTGSEFFQEASVEIRSRYGVPESLTLYVVEDVEKIRPIGCHRCGARQCMVIHQYRSRYSQNLQGAVVVIIVVRFKCSLCETTITVIPSFAHCNHVYDAHTIYVCLLHRLTTGHPVHRKSGMRVCPSWWLQQLWYKDFRYQIGFGDPSVDEMLHCLGRQHKQTILLHKNYTRMEQYPATPRNPALHHSLRIVMPLLAP